jgi:hypothetical protein
MKFPRPAADGAQPEGQFTKQKFYKVSGQKYPVQRSQILKVRS